MRVPNFVSGANEGPSRIVSADRCINLFPESIPEGNKAGGALWPAPGVTTHATMSVPPGRGISFQAGRLFAVGGNTLYEVTADGAITTLGTMNLSAQPVTMDALSDESELFIVSGTRGYILTLATDTLTSVVNNVTQGGQVDGFFVALDGNSSTLKISESLDGTTWDAGQIAQRSAAADPWIAMLVARREIYLFGERTGEVWYNSGRSPFPFVPRGGAFFEIGIASASSLARFGTTMAWLGRDQHGIGAVYWMNGYSPNEISTPEVRWQIQQINELYGLADAVGWSYQREKHQFYVLSFPAAQQTWVYDSLTNKWHQRGLWSPDDNKFLAERYQFHTEAFGKNFVCDRDTGAIYSLSSTVYTDVNGDGIRRVRRFRQPNDENKKQRFYVAELECERGVGLTAGPDGDPEVVGSNPEVVLRYSNDGGQTWGADRSRRVGKKGAYATRVRWNKCGSARDRVWELWSTDPVATRWFDFYVTAAPGRT
jgi:hypothetical protein